MQFGSKDAGASLTPLIEPFNYNLFDVYSTSSLITLSWSSTGLFSLMLRTRKKRINGRNLGEDSNGGFSYIISSWLMEEGVRVLLAPYSATSRELLGAAKASLRLGLSHPLYAPRACSLLPPPSVRLSLPLRLLPTYYHIVLFHRLPM